jgi:hypothetical protein
MRHLVSGEIARQRLAKWVSNATPLDQSPTWTETRQVIRLGGHIYPVVNGQVFQCAHCGHLDYDNSTTEVLAFFEEHFGVKPEDITVTCTVAVIE